MNIVTDNEELNKKIAKITNELSDIDADTIIENKCAFTSIERILQERFDRIPKESVVTMFVTTPLVVECIKVVFEEYFVSRNTAISKVGDLTFNGSLTFRYDLNGFNASVSMTEKEILIFSTVDDIYPN